MYNNERIIYRKTKNNWKIIIFTPLFTCEYFVFAQIEKSVFRIL